MTKVRERNMGTRIQRMKTKGETKEKITTGQGKVEGEWKGDEAVDKGDGDA